MVDLKIVDRILNHSMTIILPKVSVKRVTEIIAFSYHGSQLEIWQKEHLIDSDNSETNL